MSFMQKFNLINHYYVQLSLYIKYLLYLIPCLISFVVMNNMHDEKKEQIVKNKINVFESKINELHRIANIKTDKLTLMRSVEYFAKQNGITVNAIHQKEHLLELSCIAPLEKTLLFIDFCEQFNAFSKIEELMMNSRDINRVNSKIKLSFKNFYFKKKRKKQIKSVKKNKNIDLKLTAIVGTYALINNKWLKKNQTLLAYKLSKIHANSVELTGKEQTLILELYDVSE